MHTPHAHRPRFRVLRTALALTTGVTLHLASAPLHAQIVTENAGVLSPQTPEFHEAFSFTRAALGDELSWTQQLIFSTDRSNEFQFLVPWIDREVDRPGGGLDFAGFGDATFRWKHALVRDDGVMQSTRWSTRVEFTAPTGDQDRTDGDTAIPPDLRISRGDWSFGAGGGYAMVDDRHRFAADLMFRHHTAHDDFQLGDSVELDLAYWFRISPTHFDDLERTTEVRGVLELLSSYSWASELHGTDADGDGGTVWIAPGLQVFPLDWLLFEGNVQLPIAQSLDDAFGDRHFGAVLGLRILF